MSSPFTYLPHRAVISLTGPDTITLLERLVTNNTENWRPGEARYGALLTPQGKVIADYLALRTADGVLLDVDQDIAEAFAKRLKMFRLRSAVEIVIEQNLFVIAGTDPAAHGVRPVSGARFVFVDPRYPNGRLRAFATQEDWAAWYGYHPAEWSRPLDVYHADRIAQGIPEQGADFETASVFPSDINMDQFDGVDLKKGCFVGQEVVSRMHRRGTIRKRTLMISAAANQSLEAGSDVMAPAVIGRTTSAEGHAALALLRVDRMAKAEAAKSAITVDDHLVKIEKPDWLQTEMTSFVAHD
ncbi:MAG: folate-binding protein [Henriciella sp.]|nr:folate-binding protein [Henriciella sp.]